MVAEQHPGHAAGLVAPPGPPLRRRRRAHRPHRAGEQGTRAHARAGEGGARAHTHRLTHASKRAQKRARGNRAEAHAHGDCALGHTRAHSPCEQAVPRTHFQTHGRRHLPVHGRSQNLTPGPPAPSPAPSFSRSLSRSLSLPFSTSPPRHPGLGAAAGPRRRLRHGAPCSMLKILVLHVKWLRHGALPRCSMFKISVV